MVYLTKSLSPLFFSDSPAPPGLLPSPTPDLAHLGRIFLIVFPPSPFFILSNSPFKESSSLFPHHLFCLPDVASSDFFYLPLLASPFPFFLLVSFLDGEEFFFFPTLFPLTPPSLPSREQDLEPAFPFFVPPISRNCISYFSTSVFFTFISENSFNDLVSWLSYLSWFHRMNSSLFSPLTSPSIFFPHHPGALSARTLKPFQSPPMANSCCELIFATFFFFRSPNTLCNFPFISYVRHPFKRFP